MPRPAPRRQPRKSSPVRRRTAFLASARRIRRPIAKRKRRERNLLARPRTVLSVNASRTRSANRPSDGGGNMTILADKVVLVTGAGAGIGRAIALMMAENGAIIAAADIDT